LIDFYFIIAALYYMTYDRLQTVFMLYTAFIIPAFFLFAGLEFWVARRIEHYKNIHRRFPQNNA